MTKVYLDTRWIQEIKFDIDVKYGHILIRYIQFRGNPGIIKSMAIARAKHD